MPEPPAVLMLGLGLLAVAIYRARVKPLLSNEGC
jgi:hypothetical protein